MNRVITGWLFDVYPSSTGMTLWLLDEFGAHYKASVPFSPSFYLNADEKQISMVESLARRLKCEVSKSWIEKLELYSNKLLKVLEVKVKNPLHLKSVVYEFELCLPYYIFFNSDLTPVQSFLFEFDLFPLAYGNYIFNDQMHLLEYELKDNIDATEYPVPLFNVMTLLPCNREMSPKYRHNFIYEIGYDNRKYVTETSSAQEFIQELNNHIDRCDPDIIFTYYGDSSIMPELESLSKKTGIQLHFNRDNENNVQGSKEISYWSYGKVIHRSGSYELAGRWHLDMRNSFIMGESDLSGLIELARISRIPVQKQARTSIGTGLSSIQLAWAYRHNILIPAKKQEWEKFKTASQLLLSDRGGLLFLPLMGYHEDVAELDFASMYPALMVEHNISPETVNCSCCTNNSVPELNYTICRKRDGIISETLKAILHKRQVYKYNRNCARTEEERREYDKRQNALKWLLVTSFGYLGYKNARFGKIEAHESVNAFSRTALLRAKEIAEEMGFRIIHAIVDCIWVKKDGATRQDYEELAECITKEIKVSISLEGIYKWILFPSSKMETKIPTANRYAGTYKNGELKVRGLDMRRGDLPVVVRNLQTEVLELFAHANSIKDLISLIPEALNLLKSYIDKFNDGSINSSELVIRQRISKGADEYKNNNMQAIAAKKMREFGFELQPGETAEYIIVDHTGKKDPRKIIPYVLYTINDGYDIEKYSDLAVKSIEILVSPLGWSEDRIREYVGLKLMKKRRVSSSLKYYN